MEKYKFLTFQIPKKRTFARLSRALSTLYILIQYLNHIYPVFEPISDISFGAAVPRITWTSASVCKRRLNLRNLYIKLNMEEQRGLGSFGGTP